MRYNIIKGFSNKGFNFHKQTDQENFTQDFFFINLLWSLTSTLSSFTLTLATSLCFLSSAESQRGAEIKDFFVNFTDKLLKKYVRF